MSLVAVTKKEFLDSIRSYRLIGLTLLFVMFAVFLASIQWIPVPYRGSGDPDTLALSNSMRQPSVFLVPLVALLVGYGAIAGERETGTIKVILGLPNTRGEVLFGKVIGQTAVVSVSILVGYAAAALVALVSYESFAFAEFGLYTVLTMVYALVCISIAVSFSAGMKSSKRALASALAVYSLILVLWDVALIPLQMVAVGPEIPSTGIPEWLVLLAFLNPSTAFGYATRAVLPEYRSITYFPYLQRSLLEDWMGFIVIGLWIVIPLVLAYSRFNRGDLT